VFQVKATFFLIGNSAQNNLGPLRMQRLALAGHEIGYHSMAHIEEGTLALWDSYRWTADYDAWVETMRTLLGSALFDKAVKPYARAPYGMFNQSFLNMNTARNLTPVGWSCTPACYKGKDVALSSGDIFLLHVSDQGLEDLMRLMLLRYTFLSLGQAIDTAR
jgi:peptidoglycan/xylan/chitin deacetylase (PgdA/CDA1 family)